MYLDVFLVLDTFISVTSNFRTEGVSATANQVLISSPTFSVIINGQFYAKFNSSRGIRQGCPLSLYLFVLAVNELSLKLQDALQANITGISLGPDCPSIYSLMFADDLIICGKANMQEAQTISNILNQFC
uniref:Reverse transcriptase domain-containing protein n=1 Tax=Triticum urartu TaxID=4572 RepID=A0A8R7VE73_TRIUA